ARLALDQTIVKSFDLGASRTDLRPHRCLCRAENLSDLLRRQSLEVSEHQCLALSGRELGEGKRYERELFRPQSRAFHVLFALQRCRVASFQGRIQRYRMSLAKPPAREIPAGVDRYSI